MQENTANLINAKPVHVTTKEERQMHVENWKKSGLTMSEYCRQNNIPIANLSGWKSTWMKKQLNLSR